MENQDQMTPMTRWGIGPKWTIFCLLSATPLFLVKHLWPDALAIHLLPEKALDVMGYALLAVGIPFFVCALWVLHRGFGQGKLFTGGVYGLCRHPIYASWIVFFVPGFFLIAGSWGFVFISPVMYAWLKYFVRKEEVWLEATFQEEYRDYCRRVHAVLPVTHFLKRG